MFTIKHRTPYGNEALYAATNLQFCPVEGAALNQPVGSARESLGVLYYRGVPDGPLHELDSLNDGQVYVMNETGSTVAHYDLGGWEAKSTG